MCSIRKFGDNTSSKTEGESYIISRVISTVRERGREYAEFKFPGRPVTKKSVRRKNWSPRTDFGCQNWSPLANFGPPVKTCIYNNLAICMAYLLMQLQAALIVIVVIGPIL